MGRHLEGIFHIKDSDLGMEYSRRVVPFQNSSNQESPKICMVVYCGGISDTESRDKEKSRAWSQSRRSSE